MAPALRRRRDPRWRRGSPPESVVCAGRDPAPSPRRLLDRADGRRVPPLPRLRDRLRAYRRDEQEGRNRHAAAPRRPPVDPHPGLLPSRPAVLRRNVPRESDRHRIRGRLPHLHEHGVEHGVRGVRIPHDDPPGPRSGRHELRPHRLASVPPPRLSRRHPETRLQLDPFLDERLVLPRRERNLLGKRRGVPAARPRCIHRDRGPERGRSVDRDRPGGPRRDRARARRVRVASAERLVRTVSDRCRGARGGEGPEVRAVPLASSLFASEADDPHARAARGGHVPSRLGPARP